MRAATPGMVAIHTVLALRGSHVGAIRRLLQAFAINDGDAPAPMFDPASPLQLLQGQRNAGARRSEHDAEEIMGEREIRAVHAVIDHQHQRASRSMMVFLPLESAVCVVCVINVCA